MNYSNDSGEFHEVEPNYSGQFHVPSQPAAIPSPRSTLSCDKRLQPETWNPPGLQYNVFSQIHVRRSSHCKYLVKELIHSCHQMLQVRLRRLSAQGDLWQERKKEKEAQFQCRHLQEGRRPWTLLKLWIFHRVLWLGSTDSRYRNFH